MTVFTAEVSAPRLQLIGAARAALEPVKSTSMSSPRMRTVTAIGIAVVGVAVAVDHVARRRSRRPAAPR